MNAILLNDNKTAPGSVYPAQVLACLQREVGLERTVFTGDEVRNAPDRFAGVRYIFSTWGFPPLTEDEVRRLFPSLECVFYAAGTVQSFARPFLKQGVRVFSAWAANAVPVAEYTVSQILLANKGFFAVSRCRSQSEYTAAQKQSKAYPGNYGADIGIIGAGMIGKLVIKELCRYRLNVFVFDPFLPDGTARELGVVKQDLPTLFGHCRVISNHLANNEATRGMLDGKLFERMPPYAVFLNTGRGAQVVEPDLIGVLKRRPDLTAVLDVTHPEPPVADSPLYTLGNCILTPHIAGSTGDEVHRMAEYMVEEYRRVAAGEPCRYEITEKMLETMA